MLLFFISGISAAEGENHRIQEQLESIEVPLIPLKEALGATAYKIAIDSGKYRYLGNAKCRLCHRDFFLGRKGDKHDHAFSLLTNSKQQNSPRCLVCHSTGYGVKGGFVSVAKTPHLMNVQCEGCHGPGSIHMLGNKAGGFLAGTDRPEIIKKMCKGCHNKRWNRSFHDFEKAFIGYKTAAPRSKTNK